MIVQHLLVATLHGFADSTTYIGFSTSVSSTSMLLTSHLQILSKQRSRFRRSGVGLRFCISHQLPGRSKAAGHLSTQGSKVKCHNANREWEGTGLNVSKFLPISRQAMLQGCGESRRQLTEQEAADFLQIQFLSCTRCIISAIFSKFHAVFLPNFVGLPSFQCFLKLQKSSRV
jgi:hypothetical protein